MNKRLFRHKLRILSTVVRLTTNYNHILIKKSQYILQTGHIKLVSFRSRRRNECSGTVCKFQLRKNTIIFIFNHFTIMQCISLPNSLHTSIVSCWSYYSREFGRDILYNSTFIEDDAIFIEYFT